MKAQDNKYNETRIVKIPLEEFIASLMSVYTSGIRMIDLIVTRDALQDQVTIVIREDVPADTRKLTDRDIDNLLKAI
jgi:Holliday junction resolvase RusA-like endonuclease